jgi:hypothetical protein
LARHASIGHGQAPFIMLAPVGFFTQALGLTAASIAAGAVVAGFVAAAAGMVGGWSRKDIHDRALKDGFTGGLCGLLLLAADLLIGYG